MEKIVNDLIRNLINLYNEYGDDFVTIINGIKDCFTIKKLARVTFCEYVDEDGIRCGEECLAHEFKIGKDKKVYRGKCPFHGFKR